jgi:hypothetical protein
VNYGAKCEAILEGAGHVPDLDTWIPRAGPPGPRLQGLCTSQYHGQKSIPKMIITIRKNFNILFSYNNFYLKYTETQI